MALGFGPALSEPDLVQCVYTMVVNATSIAIRLNNMNNIIALDSALSTKLSESIL